MQCRIRGQQTAEHRTTEERRLIRLSTVAERLDCSIDTVDRFIRAGKLPVVRLPSGRRRITEEDFNRALDDWAAASR